MPNTKPNDTTKPAQRRLLTSIVSEHLILPCAGLPVSSGYRGTLMKTGTSRHPKLKALARVLGTTRRDAVGILELLWEFTAEYAPRGDIGRHTNSEIGDAVEWLASADEFVSALDTTGWIDACPEHRYVIHDWHKHAPSYLKKRLERSETTFICLVCRTADNGCRNLPNGSINPTQPNPTQSNLTQPIPAGDRHSKSGKELINLYGEKVKQPSTDTSIPQARKNAAKLLKTVSFEDLTQAVLNYAESCEALDKENDFRKNAGNFFGRESVYENFLPDAYQKPQAAPSASAKRKAKLTQWAGKGEKA